MLKRLAVGFGALLVLVGWASVAVAQPRPALVTVVHGLRGVVADVYVDGAPVLRAFRPERVTDPLPLAPRNYRIDVRPANAPADSPALVSATVEAGPGANLSVVAHLGPDGKPTLTTFDNVGEEPPFGTGRLVVRNAAARPVQVLSAGAPLEGTDSLDIEGEAVSEVPARSYALSVRATEGEQELVSNRYLAVDDGNAQFVYVIGSDTTGYNLLSQQVQMAPPPSAVNTGTSGLAGPTGPPSWGVALLILALGGALLPARGSQRP